MSDISTDTGPGVRSVHRALRLLSYLGPERRHGTLSEFTQFTGLATSTVQRLLQTLESEQFLRRLADGRYTFGTALSRLALWAAKGEELYALIQEYLHDLSQSSQETANLGVWDEPGAVVYVRQSLSPRSIRHVSWLGRPFPPEDTSMGLALYGKCNEWGYVQVATGRWEPDVAGIAAPVYDDRGKIIAGLNITGPTYRITEQDSRRLAGLVTAAAREVTVHCGGSWPHRSLDATAHVE